MQLVLILKNGQFVYTSTKTITETNSDGSAITDYLTPCTLTSGNLLGSLLWNDAIFNNSRIYQLGNW